MWELILAYLGPWTLWERDLKYEPLCRRWFIMVLYWVLAGLHRIYFGLVSNSI